MLSTFNPGMQLRQLFRKIFLHSDFQGSGKKWLPASSLNLKESFARRRATSWLRSVSAGAQIPKKAVLKALLSMGFTSEEAGFFS